MKLFDNIRAWGEPKGLCGPNTKTTGEKQLLKLLEELDELALAMAVQIVRPSDDTWELVSLPVQKDLDEIKDAIGDMTVVNTMIADNEGFTIEGCIESAYNEIIARTGKTVDGTFIKD